MKKKVFSALLLAAFAFMATSTITSCKDYDDDINNLQKQIDANKSSIEQLMTWIGKGYVVKSVVEISSPQPGIEVTMSDGTTKTQIFGIKGEKGETGAQGPQGPAGPQGEAGPQGPEGPQGPAGTNATVWTIGEDDGYWYKDGEKTDYKAVCDCQQGGQGQPGTPGTPGQDGETGPQGPVGPQGPQGEKGDAIYYVPNPTTGCFDIYKNGAFQEATTISYLGENTASGVTAVLTSNDLILDGVTDAPNGRVVISLTGNLKSLVFVPFLYLDGIETIEYPWLGDSILRPTYLSNYAAGYFDDVDHHGTTNASDLHDVTFDQNKVIDYIPNTLARHWDPNTNQIVKGTGYNDQLEVKKRRLTSADEWIYGPAWAVQYHMNPSSASADYDENAPKYNVLEPDVIYYNTRASEASLGVTSPKEFYAAQTPVYTAAKYGYWGRMLALTYGQQGLWSQKTGTFNTAKVGVLTAGIQIAKPNLLAPWPTDETINPNGNTDTPTASWPENATVASDGSTAGPLGAFTDPKKNDGEVYANYGSWYGFAKYKYNKANTDNTVALQLKNSEGDVVTSDYALLLPTRVQLEGLIWYQKPMYREPKLASYPDLGPNDPDDPRADRFGDEEGWAKDEHFDCTAETSRIHIWDSPEEALNDPNGAALELPALDPAGVDLKPYLGVHYLKEDLKKRETDTPGVYDGTVYNIGTWAYGEEAAFGLHYEFQLVDYIITTNQTRDSRYATFMDTALDAAENQLISSTTENWNGIKKSSLTDGSGIVVAKSIEYDAVGMGHTQDKQDKSSVDREPLVRVMLKNGNGDVLLDGYILLHICHTQNNATAVVRAQDKEFNLCDRLAMETTWAEFDKEVLQNTLGGWEMEAFNRTYHADCRIGTTAVPANEERFVTPYAFFVGTTPDGQSRGYELQIFNFGDLYGNVPGTTNIATPATLGGGTLDTSMRPLQSNKEWCGNAVYYLNASSPTNHVIRWELSQEEIEYLTHHASSYPVKVTRWVRWKAKDDVDGRESNTYSNAPYRYIWLQLTMNINRDQSIVYYEEKTNNYWYNWNPAGTMATADVEKGWSATVLDIMAPGSTIKCTKNLHWDSFMSDVLTENKIRGGLTATTFNSTNPWGGRTNPIEVGQYDRFMKYYFAPKTYTITGQSGTVYTITPQGPAQPDWNKLYCKYVTPHTYNNLGSPLSYYVDPVTVTANDVHTWVGAWNATTQDFNWSGSSAGYQSEDGLKKLMTTCATDYNRGMFNNTILYAKVGPVYTPIAEIMQQEQDASNPSSYQPAGSIRLFHWLPNTPGSDENLVLYDILNAMGYPMKANGTCDYEYAQKHINQQFRGWVGLVANNGCDVAKFVQQGLYDDKNSATFLASWQRPINLKTPDDQHALDAKTEENTLYLLDNIKLFDWRGDYDGNGNYMYKNGYMYRVDANMDNNHYWFWAYYNVKGIAIDMRPEKVKTNLHQANSNTFVYLNQITTQAHIWAGEPYMAGVWALWREGWQWPNPAGLTGPDMRGSITPDADDWGLTPMANDFLAQNREPAIEAHMGIMPKDNQLKKWFGSIYYENLGDNVTEFDLIVPIEIFYEWGSLKETIRWHIDTTHGRSSE